METAAFVDAVVSHALSTGYFERVNKHEPKSAPPDGLTAAVWFASIDPLRNNPSLYQTSVRLVITVRIYAGMIQEPQDGIDTQVMECVDTLMEAYTGDFTLDGLVREVDLLGQHGVPLSCLAGYLTVDKKMMRVVDINVPLIVSDAWSQIP